MSDSSWGKFNICCGKANPTNRRPVPPEIVQRMLDDWILSSCAPPALDESLLVKVLVEQSILNISEGLLLLYRKEILDRFGAIEYVTKMGDILEQINTLDFESSGAGPKLLDLFRSYGLCKPAFEYMLLNEQNLFIKMSEDVLDLQTKLYSCKSLNWIAIRQSAYRCDGACNNGATIRRMVEDDKREKEKAAKQKRAVERRPSGTAGRGMDAPQQQDEVEQMTYERQARPALLLFQGDGESANEFEIQRRKHEETLLHRRLFVGPMEMTSLRRQRPEQLHGLLLVGTRSMESHFSLLGTTAASRVIIHHILAFVGLDECAVSSEVACQTDSRPPEKWKDDIVELIRQLKLERPSDLPPILVNLLSNPSPQDLYAIAMAARANVYKFIQSCDACFPSITKHEQVAELPLQELEAALSTVARLAQETNPVLFAMLVAAQISDNDLSVMNEHPCTVQKALTYQKLDATGVAESNLKKARKRKDFGEHIHEAEVVLARVNVAQMTTARHLAETAVGRMKGNWVSFVGILIGLMVLVGGLSNKACDILSKFGIAVAENTTWKGIKKKMSQTQTDMKAFIAMCVMLGYISVIHGDNYNILRFSELLDPGLVVKGKKYTQTAVSFTMIHAAFTRPDWFDIRPDRPTAMPPLHVDGMLARLLGEAATAISVGYLANMAQFFPYPDLSDTHLTDFTNLMSIGVKSSHLVQMTTFFFCGILVGVLGLGKMDVVVGLDPECAVRLIDAYIVNPLSELKAAILPFALFHSQEHLNKDITSDPAFFVVFLSHALRLWRYRPGTYDGLQMNLIDKLLKFDPRIGSTAGADEADIDLLINDEIEALEFDDDAVAPLGTAGTAASKERDVYKWQLFIAIGNLMTARMKKVDRVNQVPENPSEDEKATKKAKAARRKQLRLTSAGKQQVAAEIAEEKAADKARKIGLLGNFETNEKVGYKKLKHFLQGFHAAFQINAIRFKTKYGGKTVMGDYVLDTLEHHLGHINMTPYIDAIVHGKAQGVYERFPSAIGLYGFYNHPNLVKVGMFNLMNIMHWQKNRPDILKFNGATVKTANDVYVEHTNSQIESITTSMFTSRLCLKSIQFASLLWPFIGNLFNWAKKITHTAKPIQAVWSDPQSGVNHVPFRPRTPTTTSDSALFKTPVAGPKQQPRDRLATEPALQVLYWEEGGRQVEVAKILDNVLDFLTDTTRNFKNPSKLSDRDTLTLGRHTYTKLELVPLEDAWKQYRPWILGLKYTDYYQYLFGHYYDNQINDNERAKRNTQMTPLKRFLSTKKHTIKDTLGPLYCRFVKWIELGDIVLQDELHGFDLPSYEHACQDALKTTRDVLIDAICSMTDLIWEGDRPDTDADRITFAKSVLVGQEENEPRIFFVDDTDFLVVEVDAKTLWEKAKAGIPSFLDTYWNTSFTKLTADSL